MARAGHLAEQMTNDRMNGFFNQAFVRSNEVEKLCGDPGKLQALLGDWGNPPLEETLGWKLEG